MRRYQNLSERGGGKGTLQIGKKDKNPELYKRKRAFRGKDHASQVGVTRGGEGKREGGKSITLNHILFVQRKKEGNQHELERRALGVPLRQ